MNWLKRIIAAKIAFIFLASFLAAGFNHVGGCDERSESIQTSITAQSLAQVKDVDLNSSNAPIQDAHFHCNHSVCCAFLDTKSTSVSKPSDASTVFFNSTPRLVGVDLSTIHRPPLA